MLYLIGGVAKSGKTYAAREITRETSIPIFSTDFLNYALSDQGEWKHDDKDEIVSIHLAPYILRIVDFCINYEGSYVIEGTHITPKLVLEINKKYPGKVKSCFLGYASSNVDDKYDMIMSHLDEDDAFDSKWFKELTQEEFKSILKEKILESKKLKIECEQSGLKYFEVNNLKSDIKDIVKYLLK